MNNTLKINLIESKGSWTSILNAARTTVRKDEVTKEPSSDWKRRVLLAEHSPIRKIVISAKWLNMPSWVSVHLVRHWLGIIHFVTSQRTDRTGIDRNSLPQDSLIDHEFEANQQAIINISKKRLCQLASRETQHAWRLFLKSIQLDHPELYSACVPDCVYRGWCFEMNPCNYYKTKRFQKDLNKYREGVNGWTEE